MMSLNGKALILCLFASMSHAVTLKWIPPDKYVNGDPLEKVEDYRISYNCGEPKTLLIDGSLTSYEFIEPGVCTITIAAIDQYGILSAESNAVVTNAPMPPILERVIPDYVQACIDAPNCKVLLTSEWQ